MGNMMDQNTTTPFLDRHDDFNCHTGSKIEDQEAPCRSILYYYYLISCIPSIHARGYNGL